MKHAKHSILAMIVALVFASGCGNDKTTQAPTPPDDAPPLPPSGLSASFAADGSVEVSWTPNAEADLAGYRVYLYHPLPAHPVSYELQNSTGLWTETRMQFAVPIGGEIWVSVCAVDLANNQSTNSAPLQVQWEQPDSEESADDPKPPMQGEQQPGGDTRGVGISTPPGTDPPPDGGDGTTPGDNPNVH